MALLFILEVVFVSLVSANTKNLPPPPGIDPIQHLTSLINQMNATFSAKIDNLTQENHELKQRLGNTQFVGFSARLSHPLKVGELQAVEYDTVITNVGNGYDPRHGHFTAPVAGVYLFAYSIMGIPNERLHLDIVKNGNTLMRAFSGSGDYTMGSQVVLTTLTVGDMVWIRHAAETISLTVNDAYYNTFSGFLIG